MLALAWRRDLSKTRAIMQSFSPRRDRLRSGPSTRVRLLTPWILAVLVSCSADADPPSPIGAAGARNDPEAPVRDLPGDGVVPTPDFDINDRQVIPNRPDRITDALDDPRDASTPPGLPPTPDAAPPDAGDAGAL